MSCQPSLADRLRLAAWLTAYAIVAPLAWLARSRRRSLVGIAGIAMLGVATLIHRAPPLRIATFNIEHYGAPAKPTDERRLVGLLRELDADVIAVQEIEDPAKFTGLVERVGTAGRRYQFVPSRCGGRSDNHLPMHVGFVVDTTKVKILGTVEYPELAPGGDDRCAIEDRPGLLAEFAVRGRRFDLLVVHFSAMREQASKRRVQWERALKIVADRQAAGVPVAIIGDVNSTGFLDDAAGERSFIRKRVAAAGMQLLTDDVPCSAYFQRVKGGALEPRALDHIAATADFPIAGRTRVTGYCAAARCRPIGGAGEPRDYKMVSNHCPVLVGGR